MYNTICTRALLRRPAHAGQHSGGPRAAAGKVRRCSTLEAQGTARHTMLCGGGDIAPCRVTAVHLAYTAGHCRSDLHQAGAAGRVGGHLVGLGLRPGAGRSAHSVPLLQERHEGRDGHATLRRSLRGGRRRRGGGGGGNAWRRGGVRGQALQERLVVRICATVQEPDQAGAPWTNARAASAGEVCC